MSQIRHTSGLDTVLRWMERTIQDAKRGGAPIDASHVITWRDALLTIHLDLVTRERNLLMGEAVLEDARDGRIVDALFAESLEDGVTKAVKRLTTLSMDAATREELREIDVCACAILDAFEALSRGIARPNHTTTGA